jgi:type II secretory pathway pseudopilin PulG
MCPSRGYAMAALLIAMSVMAILLTVALPTWKQTVQREKEEELIFRGTQYSRAISAYQRKYANASPPTLNVLVEQHYLRKKFKDPFAITEDGEFQPLYVQTQGTGSSAQAGTGAGAQAGTGSGAQAGTAGTAASTTPSGGIIGVASKNPGQSIREYNGHTHYNEWQFIPLQQTTRAGGAGAGGAGGPGGFGPSGAGPGGRGAQGGRQGTQTSPDGRSTFTPAGRQGGGTTVTPQGR